MGVLLMEKVCFIMYNILCYMIVHHLHLQASNCLGLGRKDDNKVNNQVWRYPIFTQPIWTSNLWIHWSWMMTNGLRWAIQGVSHLHRRCGLIYRRILWLVSCNLDVAQAITVTRALPVRSLFWTQRVRHSLDGLPVLRVRELHARLQGQSSIGGILEQATRHAQHQ